MNKNPAPNAVRNDALAKRYEHIKMPAVAAAARYQRNSVPVKVNKRNRERGLTRSSKAYRD
jgi:hypothetical protein